MTLDRERDAATVLARRAGALTMGYFRHAPPTDHKGVRDVVTEADRRSERLLREGLLALFPADRFLGEEEGLAGDPEGRRLWAVDPLDGTVNFVHGHPFFCVSVALLDPDGRPLVGAIEAPALGWSYVAARGEGASRNGAPIRVSRTSSFADSLIATGFPAPARVLPAPFVAGLADVLGRTQGIRRCGAAALDLAFTAEGIYDGYYEMALNAWDVAAGILLVREAGGRVTAFDGADADCSGRSVLATNGAIHEDLLRIVARSDVAAALATAGRGTG
jgi:myo-inositol-1(or 4)-monophosphatase